MAGDVSPITLKHLIVIKEKKPTNFPFFVPFFLPLLLDSVSSSSECIPATNSHPFLFTPRLVSLHSDSGCSQQASTCQPPHYLASAIIICISFRAREKEARSGPLSWRSFDSSSLLHRVESLAGPLTHCWSVCAGRCLSDRPAWRQQRVCLAGLANEFRPFPPCRLPLYRNTTVEDPSLPIRRLTWNLCARKKINAKKKITIYCREFGNELLTFANSSVVGANTIVS